MEGVGEALIRIVVPRAVEEKVAGNGRARSLSLEEERGLLLERADLSDDIAGHECVERMIAVCAVVPSEPTVRKLVCLPPRGNRAVARPSNLGVEN